MATAFMAALAACTMDDLTSEPERVTRGVVDDDAPPEEGGGGTPARPPDGDLRDLVAEVVARVHRRGYTMEDFRDAAARADVEALSVITGMTEQQMTREAERLRSVLQRSRSGLAARSQGQNTPGTSIYIEGDCNWIGLEVCYIGVDSAILIGPPGWGIAIIGSIACMCNFCWGGALEHFCPYLRPPDPGEREGGES